MKRRSTLIFFTLLALAPLLLAAWFTWRSLIKPPEKQLQRYVVTPISAERLVLCRGILQSAVETAVPIRTRGRITQMLSQGSIVKQGDLLMQIDDSAAREEIENQETDLQNTELNVERLSAQYELVDFQESKNVSLRQAQYEHALLEETEELAVPDARARRLMAIEDELAELDLADAEDNYQREKRLFDKDYISFSALEPHARALENAKAALEELRLKHELERKGATAERRVELRKNVERAKANLDRVSMKRQRRLADIKGQIEAEKRRLDEIRHRIARAQGEIDRADIHAERDGVFKIRTYRDRHSGGQIREYSVGEERHPGDVVADLIDPARMKVKLVVHEADYHELRDGMTVEINLPAYPGQNFGGRLRQLGAIGRDRNRVDPTSEGGRDSEIAMFNAEIDMDSDGRNFHPGMSAIIKVRVHGYEERLLVPRSALLSLADGGSGVRLAGESEARPLKLRYFNDQFIEVLDGLHSGDIILLQHPLPQADSEQAAITP
jgi:HlyD family secretion protein